MKCPMCKADAPTLYEGERLDDWLRLQCSACKKIYEEKDIEVSGQIVRVVRVPVKFGTVSRTFTYDPETGEFELRRVP